MYTFSMEGQKTLGLNLNILNCSEDERRSYGLGTTWGWVINDLIFIFGWTNPLSHNSITTLKKYKTHSPTFLIWHLDWHFVFQCKCKCIKKWNCLNV